MAKNDLVSTKAKEFALEFKKKASNLGRLLPKHLDPERVWKIAIAAVMKEPKLLNCTADSVWFQVAQAASLGLEVNLLGSAYLVPYGDKCNLIIGYQGYIELATRGGLVKSVESRIVRSRDKFEIEYGLSTKLVHIPNIEEYDGELRYVYAIAWLSDGTTQIDVMSKKEVDAIRSRSSARNSGPWVTDYNEMARKTVVRRLSKYLPKTIEMKQALAIEEANESGKPAFVGLDIEEDAIFADISVVPDEDSATEKLKSEMKARKKGGNEPQEAPQTPDNSTPKGFITPAEAKRRDDAYATLSAKYDGNERKIDDLLFRNGAKDDLLTLKGTTDAKAIDAIVKTAAEF